MEGGGWGGGQTEREPPGRRRQGGRDANGRRPHADGRADAEPAPSNERTPDRTAGPPAGQPTDRATDPIGRPPPDRLAAAGENEARGGGGEDVPATSRRGRTARERPAGEPAHAGSPVSPQTAARARNPDRPPPRPPPPFTPRRPPPGGTRARRTRRARSREARGNAAADRPRPRRTRARRRRARRDERDELPGAGRPGASGLDLEGRRRRRRPAFPGAGEGLHGRGGPSEPANAGRADRTGFPQLRPGPRPPTRPPRSPARGGRGGRGVRGARDPRTIDLQATLRQA
ncbi:Hypothetical predicted protein [Podarcis lilfordi]|uniref:Uncharacterized protein n=1 Tax=Podarcis lilfordi TaxID=74358 RepID=A0AA35VW97_9SAUR|nr:Hypothetical predicted protein [Podarcis lilfordi]